MPAHAVYVKGALGGWWQYCTDQSVSTENHCAIYNWRGGKIYDERFLPFAVAPLGTAISLVIATNSE